MGIYINPKNITKDEFLEQYGEQIFDSKNMKIEDILQTFTLFTDENNFRDYFLVRWVDNGEFTAAGIAYNAEELEALLYTDMHDTRHFKWYIVLTKHLKDFLPTQFIKDTENA